MAYKKPTPFNNSEQAEQFLAELKTMEDDPSYVTTSSYIADGDSYPDHKIPFCDKHMRYAKSHPQLDLRQYLSNLRIVTRKR